MPSDVRFAELKRLFESHGWTFARIRGSHHVFTKPGHRSYPVAVHQGKVRGAAARDIQRFLASGKTRI